MPEESKTQPGLEPVPEHEAPEGLESNALTFELDAPGIHASNVNPVEALATANLYFQLLDRLASRRGFSLELSGLSVVDKCVAIVSNTGNPLALAQIVAESQTILSGQTPPGRGVGELRKQLRKHFRKMRADYRVRAYVGRDWFAEIRSPQEARDEGDATEALVSLRAKLLAVGGVRPTSRWEPVLGGERFTLSLDESTAQEIAVHLYGELDIKARMRVKPDGKMEWGKLLSFAPIAEFADPLEAWSSWYRRNASSWDDVEDIEAELRKHRDA